MTDEPQTHDISELAEPRHHRAEIVFGLAAFAFALFLAASITSETTWAKGTAFARQPAFWPIVSIGFMLAFGALELWFAWRRNAAGRGDSISGEVADWVRACEYVIWFMAYVWLVPIAGYLPTTLIFAAALTLRIGYRSWRMVGFALLTGAVVVIVFKSFLSVRIPGGAVYEYLPATIRNFMILYL